MENKTTTISIVNQKGGVGKTTTSINLAGELSARGYKTLLIDLDPQGDTSNGLGFDIYDGDKDHISKFLLIDEEPCELSDIITPTNVNDTLFILQTSGQNLIRTTRLIDSDTRRRSDLRLKKAMKTINGMFDFVIIDCSPTDNILSTNALVASDYAIIPVKYDKYALAGLEKLYEKIYFIQEESNDDLEILAILPTMYMASSMMKSVDDSIRENELLSKYVSNTKIRNNIKAAEAPFSDLPINLYDKASNAAKDYKKFTDEILNKINK